MNGENPNNQVNNQNGLNGTVLGTTNTVGPTPNLKENLGNLNNPTTMPNVGVPGSVPPQGASIPNQNVAVETNNVPESLNVAPNSELVQPTVAKEPVAIPIPGTEGTPGVNVLTSNTVGNSVPLMGQDNTNPNGFVAPNKAEDIGVVPPQENNNGKKKKMNKTLFFLLIVILIAGVAFGVYYFLNISVNKLELTTKNVTIGVGETVSDNIKDYVTVKKGDINSCRLNTKNVDPTTIGNYEYSIVCKDKTYTGKVIVADTTAPEVVLKTAFKTVNSQIAVEDFIESCKDSSECTSNFVNEDLVKSYLQTAGGPYKVEIKVADQNNNEKVVEAELYITEYDVDSFYTCALPSENVEGYQAQKVINDTFPLGHDDAGALKLLNTSRRDYVYTFTTSEEYTKAFGGEKKDTITFDNITGKAFYDDENLKLTISTDLPKATLNNENNNAFPTEFVDVYRLYVSEKGYNCSTQESYKH